MNKKSIVLIGPYNTVSGYGVHARIIIKALLQQDKYDLQLISTPWGNCPMGFLDANNPEDLAILKLNLPNNQLTFQPDISIQISLPSDFQKIGKVSIGISAVTETHICPPSFLEGVNKIDLTLVPSEFSKGVLMNTTVEKVDRASNRVVSTLKCERPVEVLFEGYDEAIFNPGNIVRGELIDQLNSINESFCFLFVGHWMNGTIGQDRKNVSGLVQTFLETFMKKGGKNRPGLILKTSGAGFSVLERDQIMDKIYQIQEVIRNRTDFKGKFPAIYLLNGELSDSEMNTLYHHPKIKSFVTFQKGEAWGLPIAEFATTGKPIICSAHSGPMDYLNPDHHVLLPVKMTQIDPTAANDWLPKEGQWASVNYAFAAKSMEDVVKSYPKYLERSRKSPKYMKDNFSLSVMTTKLMEIIDRHAAIIPQKLTINLPQLEKKESDVRPTIKLPNLSKKTS